MGMTEKTNPQEAIRWQVPGSWLSAERLEELRPRLEALLADFAHLQEIDAPELEPIPGFRVATAEDAGDE
jgi:hypothetical protein